MSATTKIATAFDPVAEFRQAIAEAGLHSPKSIVADGRLHRFASNGKRGDEAGWYVLFPEGIASGAFGCWRGGFKQTWCARDPRKLTAVDRIEQRQRIAAAAEQRRQAEQAERANCRERAAAILEDAREANPSHPYLLVKRVKPFGIVQVDTRLIVSLRDAEGELHGLQFIGPDGSKRFLIGTAKRGCFHLIGDTAAAARIIIAEGFATAASIHMATGDPVAVAFDKGNLLPVAVAMKGNLPTVRIIIAGDNDADGGGQEKAREAAAAVSGAAVIPSTVKDWNDLAVAEGLEAVRAAFVEVVDNEAPVVAAPAGFAMRTTGLWWQDTSDPEKPPLHLAGQFDTVAETRDVDGSAWGVLLRWLDHDGRNHEWAMPRAMLASDGADARRMLLDGGLYVAPGKKARDLLNSYLGSVKVSRRARAVVRMGWHGRSYVLPDGTLGPSNGERVLLQTTGTVEHAFRVRGELTGWQEQVASIAVGNSRLTLALATGFAAPLLEIVGAESGGFHFRGASSTGKSTALLVAGSVWGGGDVSGFVRPWRLTSNGLEGVAAGHCDSLLCLDELGQVAAKEAGEVA